MGEENMRLEFTKKEAALRTKADRLEAEAKRLRDLAVESRNDRERKRPANDRLIYAARSRCPCGYGFAYDPLGELTTSKDDGPFRRPSQWECAGTLLYTANELDPNERAYVRGATHEIPLPFAFYEIKSENQPSAHGATTREKADPLADAPKA